MHRLHFPFVLVGLHKFCQNFNALFNLQNSSAEFRWVCCRERESAAHGFVGGGSAASSAAATSCAERTPGSVSRVVKRVNQQQCTQHLVHSHDTCALHTHSRALSLALTLSFVLSHCYCCVLSRQRNWTKAERRSLSHCLPAYTKICSEQFSLKSSLAEFTSHLSWPARHAVVAQPNNKRITTVEVEAAVDA